MLCDDAETEIAEIASREVDGLDLTLPLLAVREYDSSRIVRSGSPIFTRGSLTS